MPAIDSTNRRHFLVRSAAALGVAALPAFVPGGALGLDPKKAAASERITLGVIGIGPRCKYVLPGMLGLPDVQCVAIADVQASRRDAGKEMVDKQYWNVTSGGNAYQYGYGDPLLVNTGCET